MEKIELQKYNNILQKVADAIEKDCSSSIHKGIEKLAFELSKQKEEIIRNRLIECGFLDILDDLEKGIIRKFPKMTIQKYPDREEYWVDDGSVSGHLLITFYHIQSTPIFKDNKHIITAEIKYK